MSRKNKNKNGARSIGISRQIFYVALFAIMNGLIPGVSEKPVFSQSTQVENKLADQNIPTSQKHTITSTPGDSPVSLGRNDVSLKSTDAAINPIFQQPPVCINCGIVDFTDVIGPGTTAAVISGGIISGVVGSTILRRKARRNNFPVTTMRKDTYPTIRHFNGGPANPIINHSTGIIMNDDTEAVLQQPITPNHFGGEGNH